MRRFTKQSTVFALAIGCAFLLALISFRSQGFTANDFFLPPDRSDLDLSPNERGVDTGADTNGQFESGQATGRMRQATLQEVLQMARTARAAMQGNLRDYTARFVKQEADQQGVLGSETVIQMRVQTRVRDGSDSAPMRVYLHFLAPESVRGREVIWAKDLHDGQLLVHEAGLLGFTTLRLDPTGLIAMRGQRYPIYEVGLVRLVEKLIERGQDDLDDPAIQVWIDDHAEFDGEMVQRIEVRRQRPTQNESDYSLAEIVIDPARQLVIRYRSYGWAKRQGAEAPLLESYSYHDVQTNVGLSERDFDPANPDYRFP